MQNNVQKTKLEKPKGGPLENQKFFHFGKHFWAFLSGLGHITSRILSI